MIDIRSIEENAIRSGKWALLAKISQVLGGSVLFLILPFWLSPNDFGIITMFTSVLAFILIMQQPGLMESVIQNEENSEKVRDAGYWLSLLVSMFLYLFIYILSPMISRYFNQAELVISLRVVGLQIVLLGFSNIPMAWLQREFQYKSYALIQLTSSTLMVIVSIYLAIRGMGYWSYIIGILSGAFIRSVLVIVFIKWKPAFRFNLFWWAIILKFGFFVLLEMILGWFLIWFDNVIVAKYMGSNAAGIYALAFNISTTVISIPISAITGVTLSTFSRLQQNLQLLQKAYLKGTKIIASYAIPACLGFSIIGPTLINLIYPGRWDGIAEILPILSLYAGFGQLWILNTDAFKAIGKPNIMIKIYIPVVIIMVPLFLIGSQLGLFIFTLIRSLVIIIGAIPQTYFAIKCLGLEKNYLFKIIKTPMISSFGMLISIWLLNQVVLSVKIESFSIQLLMIIISIVISCAIYVMVYKLVEPASTMEFMTILQKTMRDRYEK